MKFFDRHRELARLDGLVQSEGGGLAVLWGRRRIGKTRLLLEWCKKRGGLYTVADQSTEAVQLRYFAEAAEQILPGFASVTYPSWRVALEALSRDARARGWRGPLVIDELPYLVASSPALPSVLQRWLDHDAREAGLVVALAGSAQHMMHGLALDGSSPLYGRADQALRLAPLPAGDIVGALGLDDPLDAVRAYSAWGGVPRYWELAAPHGDDVEHAIDHLVLDPLGPLHQEPDRVLGAELPSAASLRPILDAIGSGAHKVSEIGGRLGQPSTSLSRPLSRLVELGFVRRERPYGVPERRSKRTLYKVADPFLRMWFTVVAPRRAQLADGSRTGRLAIWRRAAPGLLAAAFEDLCRQALPRLGEDGGRLADLKGFHSAGRFWPAGGPEWDLVSTSHDDRRLLLCEVKWRERDVDARQLAAIVAELDAKGRPADRRFAGLEITRAVIVPRLRPRVRPPENVVVVQAKDIFGVLR